MEKKRPCIGGLLLLIAAIWFFVNSILSFVIQYSQYSQMFGAEKALLATALPAFFSLLFTLPNQIPHIIIGILLMKGKFGKGVIVCSVIDMVWQLLMLLFTSGIRLLTSISGLSTMTAPQWYFYFQTAAFITMTVVYILAATPKNPGKKIWFLPGALAAVYAIGLLITNVSDIIKLNLPFWQLLKSLPYPLLITASFFLIGFWLAGHTQAKPRPAYPAYPPQPQYSQQPQYRPPVQQPVYPPQYRPAPPQPTPVAPPPAPSVSAELERYRALLDNGTITQEEFEVLKKRLLNM